MRKYAVIYRSVCMENLQYAANIVMGFASYFVFIFIFIMLWNYIYQMPGEVIAGYTKEQMIWYVMMTEMIWFASNSASVAGSVTTDIRGMEHPAAHVRPSCGGSRYRNGGGSARFPNQPSAVDDTLCYSWNYSQCGVFDLYWAVVFLDRRCNALPVAV